MRRVQQSETPTHFKASLLNVEALKQWGSFLAARLMRPVRRFAQAAFLRQNRYLLAIQS